MADRTKLGEEVPLMTMDPLVEFYRSPGPTSDLGRYSDLVTSLPDTPQALASIVHGLLINISYVRFKKLEFSAERHSDAERIGALSTMEGVLALGDEKLLVTGRPQTDRMIGFCYHFAVLLCALMRAKGYSARARCGFASYFRPGFWIDH